MRGRLRVSLAACLLMPAAAAMAQPCESCHPRQARSQPATDMAWALAPPGSNRVLQENPKLTLRKGVYQYAIETRDGQSLYSVTDGKDQLSVPIRWSFGLHSQTWVLEYSGRFYESLVSYFAPGKSWTGGLDTTIGDNSIHPQTLLEAFGRELTEFEVKSCFECHATNAVSGNRLQLDGIIAGVQCERCHPGAEHHRQSLAQGKTPSIPQKLGSSTPEEISNFCGQCHRTWERVVRDRLRGEINVRFQPYRLANSRCYDGGDRRMSCITCHDPHHDVVRGAAAYDAKCQACHSTGTARAVGSTQAKVCRVATSGCVTCHMPKVELPGGHMVFSDHQIRIVRAGDAYPN